MLKLMYILSLVNLSSFYGSIAIVQGILLNRLKLAFAAAPVFVGLSAYFFAAIINDTSVWFVVILFIFSVWLILWFQPKLSGDHYLLASIALMEVLSALISLPIVNLGGREGLVIFSSDKLPPANFEMTAITFSTPIVLLCWMFYQLLFLSNIGVFIDRIGELGREAERWFPARKITQLIILLCIVIFVVIGYFYLQYSGGISPNIFSLKLAFLFVVFSVISLKSAWAGLILSLLFFTLPYLVDLVFDIFNSYLLEPLVGLTLLINQDYIAEIINILWGVIVIKIAVNYFTIDYKREIT